MYTGLTRERDSERCYVLWLGSANVRFRFDFYPSAIKAVGYSDHQMWAVGRAGTVRNSALTKKLTDEFCLFFTDMTYVPGQFIPYIFFGTKP